MIQEEQANSSEDAIEHLRGYALSSIDETSLYYHLSKPLSAKATLILCDGIGCHGYIWKKCLPELEGDFNVLRWHYRGHGESGAPLQTERTSITDHALDFLSILKCLEANLTSTSESIFLLGHSMGVQVALEIYRQKAQWVDGLVLACGTYGNPITQSPSLALIKKLLPTLKKTVDKAPRLFNLINKHLLQQKIAYTVATVLEINPNYISEEDFRPYLDGMADMDIPLFLSMLEKLDEHEARDLLPSIDAPTLVISGDRDGFTPTEASEALANEIPNSEFFLIKEGSHTTPLERPDLFNKQVLDFILKHSSKE